MSASNSVAPARTGTGLGAFGMAVLVGVVGAAVATTLIALLAHAFGVPSQVQQLKPAVYLPFVVIGVLVGAVAWRLIRARASDPRRLLTWLVPTVIGISLIPDLLLGFAGSAPDTTWGGVVALMLMHLAVAAVAVPAYLRYLPLPN